MRHPITYCKSCGSKIAFACGSELLCARCTVPGAIVNQGDTWILPASTLHELAPDSRPILSTAILAIMAPLILLLVALGFAQRLA